MNLNVSLEYRRWNYCLGGIFLFLLLFMATAVFILHLPCPYLLKIGRPCVLCGCTRDFLRMLKGAPPLHNPASFLLFWGMIAELCWRALICFAPIRILPFLLCGDVAGHALFFILLLVRLF